jgi:hypothetical protein
MGGDAGGGAAGGVTQYLPSSPISRNPLPLGHCAALATGVNVEPAANVCPLTVTAVEDVVWPNPRPRPRGKPAVPTVCAVSALMAGKTDTFATFRSAFAAISGASSRCAIGCLTSGLHTDTSVRTLTPVYPSAPNPASCQKLLAPEPRTHDEMPNGRMMPSAVAAIRFQLIQSGVLAASALYVWPCAGASCPLALSACVAAYRSPRRTKNPPVARPSTPIPNSRIPLSGL